MDKTIKLACLLAMVIFSSCASRKDFVYLQDMDELQEYPMVQKYEAIIHRDDRLSIIVNSKNPELSLPFNMSGSRSYSVEADGTISNNEVGALSDEKEKGYLVDINGNIDFPVLGQLHVEGLTRRQLTELIKKTTDQRRIAERSYGHRQFLELQILRARRSWTCRNL